MRSSPPARPGATTLLWVASCLGACAEGVGADGSDVGLDTRQDTGVMIGDSGAGRDASVTDPADAGMIHVDMDSGSATRADSSVLDANLNDAGVDTRDVGADGDSGRDTGVPDGGGSGSEADSGQAKPDGSTEGDSGPPDAGQTPVNCTGIARSGVQLCDMGVDYCGAVFMNSAGCSAVCAAAGLNCATSYENVEGQCARDETRPTLPCDSGHVSDYCLCRW